MSEMKSDAATSAAEQAGDGQPTQKPLTPEAQRALAEAEERRKQRDAEARRAKELGGRQGPDPVRYGDWENDGIASDF